LVCLAGNLTAQQPAATETKEEAKESGEAISEPVDRNQLPAPFEMIRGNIRSLEATGFFTLVDARIDNNAGEQRVAWTVRVNKPITGRHLEALLREFRDARFYYTLENGSRVEILSTVLQYSHRLTQETVDGRIFNQDDVFEVWLTLPELDQRKLLSRKADRVVFRRWKY